MNRSSGSISIRSWGMPALSRASFFSLDIGFIVDPFQCLANRSEGRFQLAELCVKICCLGMPGLDANVALASIVEIQIHARNTMFVQVDPLFSPHEHEGDTAFFAEPVHERLPIGLHPDQPRYGWGTSEAALCAPACWYMSLSSRLNCKSWRSSSIVGSGALFACWVVRGRASPSCVPVPFSATT
jgi:hypothetical protein